MNKEKIDALELVASRMWQKDPDRKYLEEAIAELRSYNAPVRCDVCKMSMSHLQETLKQQPKQVRCGGCRHMATCRAYHNRLEYNVPKDMQNWYCADAEGRC